MNKGILVCKTKKAFQKGHNREGKDSIPFLIEKVYFPNWKITSLEFPFVKGYVRKANDISTYYGKLLVISNMSLQSLVPRAGWKVAKQKLGFGL